MNTTLAILSIIWSVVLALLLGGGLALFKYYRRQKQLQQRQRHYERQKRQRRPLERATWEPRITQPLARSWSLSKCAAIEDTPTIPGVSSPQTGEQRAASTTRSRKQTTLEVGIGWNTGFTRRSKPNEDSAVALQGTCTYNERLVPFGLFVIADGMGGHDFGQEASRIAMQSMMQQVLCNVMAGGSLSDESLTKLLVEAVEQANTTIYEQCQELGMDMGTTLTAALIVDMRAYIVNVGDSRAYLVGQRERLAQITQDHSLVAMLVASGSITPEELYTHPERNKVYRSLGHDVDVDVDSFTRELRNGDYLLLCSDGLWEMVHDAEIEQIIKYGVTNRMEPTQMCEVLVQAALREGGVDNVSVILVRVEG